MKTDRQVLTSELPRLRRFSYSLTADYHDADDLVQTVIVKVLEKGLPDMRDPTPWLLTMCKNLWLDTVRHEAVKQRHANEGVATDEQSSYTDPSSTTVEAVKVIERMQLLSEGQRLALSLVAIEGLSYAEAGRVLDVPVGTIMSRVCRARLFLKQQLGEHSC